jgi:hypothetical protein
MERISVGSPLIEQADQQQLLALRDETASLDRINFIAAFTALQTSCE